MIMAADPLRKEDEATTSSASALVFEETTNNEGQVKSRRASSRNKASSSSEEKNPSEDGDPFLASALEGTRKGNRFSNEEDVSCREGRGEKQVIKGQLDELKVLPPPSTPPQEQSKGLKAERTDGDEKGAREVVEQDHRRCSSVREPLGGTLRRGKEESMVISSSSRWMEAWSGEGGLEEGGRYKVDARNWRTMLTRLVELEKSWTMFKMKIICV